MDPAGAFTGAGEAGATVTAAPSAGFITSGIFVSMGVSGAGVALEGGTQRAAAAPCIDRGTRGRGFAMPTASYPGVATRRSRLRCWYAAVIYSNAVKVLLGTSY